MKVRALIAVGVVLGLASQSLAGVILQPASASTNMGQASASFPPSQVIDQSGLSVGYASGVDDFDTYLALNPTHNSSSASTIWASMAGIKTGNFDFDLGATFKVRSMALWTRPFFAYPIDFNLVGAKSGDFSDAVALGSYTSLHPGVSSTADHEVFSFTEGEYRFIRMEILTSDPGTTLVELGEAAFDVLRPVPDTMCDVVMDFEILAEAGTSVALQEMTYSEDGFTLNHMSGKFSFASWQLGASNFAGSTGFFNNSNNGVTELVKDDGGAFRLASIGLAPLNSQGATSATFIGERDGMQVAMQTMTTTATLAFQTFNFNADFSNVDRITWIQTTSGGTFHQFDDIALTAPMEPVIDFESLAQAGNGSHSVGATYSEDGFTLTPASGSIWSFELSASSFAGSTGVYAGNLTTIELIKEGGGAFRLAAIDLSRLNSTVRSTTVTFTGELDGSPVASQMFTTSTDLAFQSFVFNDDFKNVDRVTWVQEFTPATHQFDDIVVGDAVATILESAALGPTGQEFGFSLNNQFIAARFSLNEPTRITEIGGHIGVTSGTIWGAIIALPGPGALPPMGFDVQANALASALFESTDGFSAELCRPVDAILPPGDYALLFGDGGLFGSTGTGFMPSNNTDNPSADYFFKQSGGSWVEDTITQVRFIVRGTPFPCDNCLGDADGSGIVNFGDVTSVLGNWLNVCPTNETVFESATLGPTGHNQGLSLLPNQFLGTRFSLTEPTRITAIGAHLFTVAGSVWGAIIPLSSPGALPPDGFDVEAEALASALFGATAGGLSEDVVEPVDVILAPGDYALVFGAGGLFGSTGTGAMTFNNTDIGTPEYFFWKGVTWNNGGFINTRFVVEGDGLCTTCDGDADGSGTVNFGDITSVLGNWLNICP